MERWTGGCGGQRFIRTDVWMDSWEEGNNKWKVGQEDRRGRGDVTDYCVIPSRELPALSKLQRKARRCEQRSTAGLHAIGLLPRSV